MEIRNDNDRRLWFRIKSIDKKVDNLGKIGSKNFDWVAWEELTDESARLYSQLSVHRDIVNNLKPIASPSSNQQQHRAVNFVVDFIPPSANVCSLSNNLNLNM